MSVRGRLTIWHASVLALLVVCFAVATFLILRARLYGRIEDQLTQDLALLHKAYPQGEYEVAELDEHGAIGLFQVGGALRFQSHGWRRVRLDQARNPGADRWTWSSPDGREYRLARAQGEASGRAFEFIVAQDTTHARSTIRTLVWVMVLALPVALGAAGTAGYFLTGRLLGPVGIMADRAHRITAESFSERLPVENPRDEFGRLAIAFNETLTRLQDAFERLRRFTADASHELRTPLTALRSVGEVALQNSMDPAAYRDVIGSMLEEVDRLSRLVDGLLTLTRGESGRVQPKPERVDLTELSRSVVEVLRILAEERDQTLTIEAATPVHTVADPAILRQAVTNILDNAIKYTPPKGTIRVAAKHHGTQESVIEIEDSGPGIPEPHREKIFERFYRVDGDRSRETGGVGLGLAIARWAVETNRGRIELDTKPGEGSTFRIVLPRAEPT